MSTQGRLKGYPRSNSRLNVQTHNVYLLTHASLFINLQCDIYLLMTMHNPLQLQGQS